MTSECREDKDCPAGYLCDPTGSYCYLVEEQPPPDAAGRDAGAEDQGSTDLAAPEASQLDAVPVRLNGAPQGIPSDVSGVVVAPDGLHVAFTSDARAITVTQVGGGQPRQLLEVGANAYPEVLGFSVDSNQVIALVNDSTTEVSHIHALAVDGSADRVLAEGSVGTLCFGRWLPQTQTVLHSCTGETNQVAAVSLAGEQRLLTAPLDEVIVAFFQLIDMAADESVALVKAYAVSSGASIRQELWTVPMDGSGEQVVASDANDDFVHSGALSPDATRVLFPRTPGGALGFRVVNVDGTDPHDVYQLSSFGGGFNGEWLDQAQVLLWVAKNGEPPLLLVADAAGAGSREIGPAGHAVLTYRVAPGRGGVAMLSRGQDGHHLSFYEADSGTTRELRALGAAEPPLLLAFSADSARVACGVRGAVDEPLRLEQRRVDTAALVATATLPAAARQVAELVFDPHDGALLARAETDRAGRTDLLRLPATGGWERLDAVPWDASPGVSWLGATPGRLLYLADQDARQVFELFSVQRDGGERLRLNADLSPGAGAVGGLWVQEQGARALYLSDAQRHDGQLDVFSVGLDGSGRERLSDDTMGTSVQDDAQLSADGAMLLYRQNGVWPDQCLMALPLPEGAPQRMDQPEFSHDRVMRFGLSPDDQHLVYVADSTSDTVEPSVLYVVRRDGSGHRALGGPWPQGAQGVDCNLAPCLWFTPDGQRVLLRAQARASGPHELWSLALEGDAATRPGGELTATQSISRWLKIAPDSRHVVFARGQSGPATLMAAEVSGAAPVPLSQRTMSAPDFWEIAVALSPDGQRVVYRADDRGAGRDELFAVGYQGQDRVRLSPDLSGDDRVLEFAISGDARHVAFLTGPPPGPLALYAAPIAGGIARRIDQALGPGYTTERWLAPESRPDRVLYAARDAQGRVAVVSVRLDGTRPSVLSAWHAAPASVRGARPVPGAPELLLELAGASGSTLHLLALDRGRDLQLLPAPAALARFAVTPHHLVYLLPESASPRADGLYALPLGARH